MSSTVTRFMSALVFFSLLVPLTALSDEVELVVKPAATIAVTLDCSGAPEATEWGENAVKVIDEWYPKLVELLDSDGFRPATTLKLTFKKMDGVAYATGREIVISADWIANHPDDIGMVIHELIHIVQAYRSRVPSWVTEGLADGIRFFVYEKNGERTCRVNPNRAKYTDSYRTTGAFFNWIVVTYDKDFYTKLNTICRAGKYSDAAFADITGKELPMLWDEFIASLRPANVRAASDVPPELDAYLAKPDDSFQWEIVEKNETMIHATMTSQTWHDIVWTHSLLLAFPPQWEQGEHMRDHVLLYIGGGRVGGALSDGDRILGASLAAAARMPVVILLQVPNQPLFGNYVEDALIGETLLKAIAEQDTTWPLLFPMAKSAIRAMDAAEQIIRQERNRDVRGFIVSGASKRGWTTWLTGASKDPRVRGIAPIVIDTLNMAKQMPYQVETWGTHSASIHDYTERNLVRADQTALTPFEQRLWAIIDPYSYRSRITMPKLLIHGTNDPYWTVDATRHYWDDLVGPKYILTLPNVGHDLGIMKIKAIQSLAVFANHVAAGVAFPRMTWQQTEDDKSFCVTVDSEFPATKVLLWTATSETKDFRQAKWSPQTIASGTSEPIRISKPSSGHIAFYVELQATEENLQLPCSLTTQVWRF